MEVLYAVPRLKRIKLFKVTAGQDFHIKTFDFGPGGRWFDVEHYMGQLKCTADGYGNLKGHYGNGAIFISRKDHPEFFPDSQE
jgi:hypothetical protein